MMSKSFGIMMEVAASDMEKDMMRKLQPWLKEQIGKQLQKYDFGRCIKLEDEIIQLKKDKEYYMQQYAKYKTAYRDLVKELEPPLLTRIANRFKEALF